MIPARNFLSVLAVSAAFCVPAFAGSPADVFPAPHSVKIARSVPVPASELSPRAVAEFPVLAEALRSRKISPNGRISVRAVCGNAAAATLKSVGVPAVSGAYALSVSHDAIEISAHDGDGVFYALQTLAQMIEVDGKIQPCVVGDWPDVPFRGSIEGFYGKPWEHERRLAQIRFYGKYKMNAYIYGPKDDPYSGFNSAHWRDFYPEEQAKQISELVRVARENRVNFIWALHPGASIRWHDNDGDGIPADVIAALKKFEAMYALGVRAFAVFFDDIGGEGAKAEKQAEMLNFLNREFIKKKPDVAPLLMCPTDYAGTHGSAYKKQLGEKLDADINIMWTGPGICSDIPALAVGKVAGHFRRAPFIWWNWPVDDYCRTNLLLGRTYGLDKGNKGRLAGFASNPMDKPEASKIALFGVADWAWNIDDFDSEKSWRAAFPRLFPSCPDAMFLFAEHNSDQGKNGHGYRREESVRFKPIADKTLAQYRAKGVLDAKEISAAAKEFSAVSSAAQTLEKTLPQSDPALWHEIEFWVKSFEQLGIAGTAALELASGGNENPAARLNLFSAIAAAKARQQDAFDAQKNRHRAETFPSDRQWATGCRVGTLVLTPFVDEIFNAEWKKTCAALGEKADGGNAVYKAFSNAKNLAGIQAERNGIYVELRRILEVVKLDPAQYIGLALPEGVFANYVHVKLDNARAANSCAVKVSRDGKNWEDFPVRRNGGELQNPISADKKIRFFRLENVSASPVEFRIDRLKFDVPADAKTNAEEAAFDRNPQTFYTVSAPKKFVGPAGTQALAMTDSPAAVRRRGNVLEIVPQNGKSVRVFEIFWK